MGIARNRDRLCLAHVAGRGLQPGLGAVGSRDTLGVARVRGLAHRRGVPGQREGARRLKTAELPWAGWPAAACGGADMAGLDSSATAGPERIGGERPARPARALPGPAGARGGGWAATEGGSGQPRAERPRQRAAARPGPSLAGDPHRQRGNRTDSARPAPTERGRGRVLDAALRHPAVLRAGGQDGPRSAVRQHLVATPRRRRPKRNGWTWFLGQRGRNTAGNAADTLSEASIAAKRDSGAKTGVLVGKGSRCSESPRKGPGKPAHRGGRASSQCAGLVLGHFSWGF